MLVAIQGETTLIINYKRRLTMSDIKDSLGNENRVLSYLLLLCLIGLVAINLVLGSKIIKIQQSISTIELKIKDLASGDSQVPVNQGLPYTGKLEVSTAQIYGELENPEVLIVEFLDYECPYCAQANMMIGELLKSIPGKIIVVRFDYPLPFHENAFDASLFANCVSEQGLVDYKSISTYLFENQSALDRDSLLSSAATLNLDVEEIRKCIDSREASDRIEKSIRIGEDIGIKGTPAFLISNTFEIMNSSIVLEGELIYLSQLSGRIKEMIGN